VEEHGLAAGIQYVWKDPNQGCTPVIFGRFFLIRAGAGAVVLFKFATRLREWTRFRDCGLSIGLCMNTKSNSMFK